jgi:hypothetical protein
MKNCAAGKRTRALKKIGPWLVGLALLASPSFANTDRIGWIIEQLVLPPLPPVTEKAGVQAIAQGVNYSDAFSLMGDVLYDTRLFDFGLKYSERLFPAWTQEGQSLKLESLGLKKSFSAQIGRGFLTTENHFGRFSAEFIQFDPSTFRLLRLGFNTAILDTVDVPWILRLNFHVLIPLRQPTSSSRTRSSEDIQEGLLYNSSVEIGQKVIIGNKASFQLGGMFHWTYRTRTIPEDLDHVGEHYEHMLFSIGPWAEYGNKTSQIRLALPWRIWLDKEVFEKPVTTSGSDSVLVRYPNVISLPDVSLVWALAL